MNRLGILAWRIAAHLVIETHDRWVRGWVETDRDLALGYGEAEETANIRRYQERVGGR